MGWKVSPTPDRHEDAWLSVTRRTVCRNGIDAGLCCTDYGNKIERMKRTTAFAWITTKVKKKTCATCGLKVKTVFSHSENLHLQRSRCVLGRVYLPDLQQVMIIDSGEFCLATKGIRERNRPTQHIFSLATEVTLACVSVHSKICVQSQSALSLGVLWRRPAEFARFIITHRWSTVNELQKWPSILLGSRKSRHGRKMGGWTLSGTPWDELLLVLLIVILKLRLTYKSN